ncbi:MAG: hypothetical protein VB860_08160 [Dehalococcoidia bacterium]
MTDGMSTETIARRIREYESLGIHRTGWPGDMSSADWAQAELVTDGIDASLEKFDFPMFRAEVTRVIWVGGKADGVALHDCGSTGANGVSGQFVLAGSTDASDPSTSDLRGKIVVGGDNDPAFEQRSVYERIVELEAAGAAGLVLRRTDSLGAINVLNAYRIGKPFSLPVLQVSGPESMSLSDAARAGESGTLTVDAVREPATAMNVVATLPGNDPDAAPMAIMTPRSGWFICASERGGGIAIWLGLAQVISAMPSRRRTVHMVASSGHEINHYGLQAFLNSRDGLETRAIAWLHLGALIGSRATSVKIEPSDPELGALAKSSFESSGADRWMMWNQRGGEAENIAKAGGRYVSLRGGRADGEDGDTFFHSPNDSIDRASDIELVAASGRACIAMVEALVTN